MLGKKNQSALLAKYAGMYKKNPRSKVFAPLAESFRKLGMVDDALKVLKDGIRYHPNYALGYIVLAHCYFDQGKFDLTYNTLRPIVAQNADNISLQKIFAQACMNLGNLEEALDTYKYLLFMNPSDKFFAQQVKKLEDDLHIGHKKFTLDQIVRSPDMDQIPVIETAEDDWVQVDFNRGRTAKEAAKIEAKTSDQKIENEWVMERPGRPDNLDEGKVNPLPSGVVPEKPMLRSLEDDFYADEFEEHGDVEEANEQELKVDAPIVSHTLIDLYCAQKYYDKAIELLEKIIELNPHDKASLGKLAQVRALKEASVPSVAAGIPDESDGHAELINIIETKVKTKTPTELKINAAFERFLNAVKEQSQLHR